MRSKLRTDRPRNQYPPFRLATKLLAPHIGIGLSFPPCFDGVGGLPGWYCWDYFGIYSRFVVDKCLQIIQGWGSTPLLSTPGLGGIEEKVFNPPSLGVGTPKPPKI